MKRLDRLLGIALQLSARRRLRAGDLARRFGVSLRTVGLLERQGRSHDATVAQKLG